MKRTDDLIAFLREHLAPYFLGQDTWQASGTDTPVYYGGTTVGVTTHTFQDAAWVRKGTEVTVRGQIAWSAATGTGNARISLPFTAAAANFTGSLYVNGVTFANGAPQMLITASTNYFTMGSPLTNAGPTVVAVEAAGNIIYKVVYFIA